MTHATPSDNEQTPIKVTIILDDETQRVERTMMVKAENIVVDSSPWIEDLFLPPYAPTSTRRIKRNIVFQLIDVIPDEDGVWLREKRIPKESRNNGSD